MQKLPKTPEKPGQSPQNNRAQREKISCRTKKNPRKEKQPELSLPRIERKAEQGQKQQQQKQRVQHCPELRQEPSRRAQKIIDEAKQSAKKQGLRKLLRLKKNRKLHQPNSRPKKPPAGAASS